MSYSIFLKKNEDKRIREGHPWIYANEVDRIEGKGKNGELATVYDSRGGFLGRGFINHASKILVRIFIRDENADVSDEGLYAILTERLKKANDYRIKLGYTNCYRMVFAEADGLPALIVDKYGDILSVQFLSLGVDMRKKAIVKALTELFNPRGIYERSDVAVRKKEGLEQVKGPIYGEFDPVVTVVENGLKMVVDIENGQKTGYFLDQKENRFAVRRYSKDAEVLDCFCNVGGFSVNAAAAGAKNVVALDISEKALADVRKNAEMNGLTNVETVCGDVFEVLREYKKAGRMFDTIILDPPAFCKTAADVPDAYKGYRDINVLAMKLVKPGGFLLTASCSHYMTFPLFERMLQESAKMSGRNVRTVEVRTQAADHPSLVSVDETTYLKFFVLNVN